MLIFSSGEYVFLCKHMSEKMQYNMHEHIQRAFYDFLTVRAEQSDHS